jgi:hypothetical protein
VNAISRRSFLSAAAAAAASWPVLARAQAPLSVSSIYVDSSHLRSLGVTVFADIVDAAMTEELRRVFADRLGPGPGMVVRVTGLFLTSLPGGQGFRGSSTDSIDGEALLVGPRGAILARYPQHAVLVPAGAWYDPLNEQKRAAAVARVYARWLRRTVA